MVEAYWGCMILKKERLHYALEVPRMIAYLHYHVRFRNLSIYYAHHSLSNIDNL